MATAISEAITNIAEAERQLDLSRCEEETFFREWHRDLPKLSTEERDALDLQRKRYIYQRSERQLLEGTVTLLVASPLLATAGLYDPPFRICAEESVQLTLRDREETLQGRLDILVLRDRLWVVVVESKKTALSVWTALPQTLAYLMANPQPHRPSFGLMTNGDEILFVKLQQHPSPQYDVSRIFAPLSGKRELYQALQILKRIRSVIVDS
ncbi:type I restriction endonuclease subunit R [Leptolyngbya valderiana BDU 20041]|nr:type I restriction endonuclease subunit R [Leptolyngbya valderiana BDU 20041]PPT05658.1 hypothetical protein CKA32_001927 [Geitlerinema sp. FC II]